MKLSVDTNQIKFRESFFEENKIRKKKLKNTTEIKKKLNFGSREINLRKKLFQI